MTTMKTMTAMTTIERLKTVVMVRIAVLNRIVRPMMDMKTMMITRMITKAAA